MPRATPKKLQLTRLHELLAYDPETGSFVWKVPQRKWAAGSVAGRLHKSAGGKRYWILKIDGEQILAHRLAWFYMTGTWPFPEIDHDDGDGLNNRFINLKETTRLKNSKNLSLHRKSATGVTGVRIRPGGRYEAAIFLDGQRHYLGMHATLEDAARVRRAAETAMNFHPHHGKPPGQPSLMKDEK